MTMNQPPVDMGMHFTSSAGEGFLMTVEERKRVYARTDFSQGDFFEDSYPEGNIFLV